jgi:hypothetical protein
MGSISRLPGIMTVAAIAGTGLMAAPAAQAQVMARPAMVSVPCGTAALASAISAANSRDATTLRLTSGCTYSITTPATGTDGLPIITGNIAIEATGNTVISRSTAAPTAFRILDVAAHGALSLSGVTVRNGSTTGLGGAILNAGRLQITNVVLSGNAAGNGGALANASGASANVLDAVIEENTTTGVGGGGIINSGTLRLAGSRVYSNSAPINGGGLNTQASGISQITQSSFSRNVSGSLGGAISNLGSTSLTQTVVRQNSGYRGGGIATANSNVALHASVFSGNTPDNCNPLNTIPGCVN